MGEALEAIDDLVEANAPRWKVWLKVASTVFFVGLATGHYVVIPSKAAEKK